MYFGRAFFVTAAYHRYFSHKAYRLNRFWQFVFAFQAEATAQKGVLWWAANHRHHHRSSDTAADRRAVRGGQRLHRFADSNSQIARTQERSCILDVEDRSSLRDEAHSGRCSIDMAAVMVKV